MTKINEFILIILALARSTEQSLHNCFQCVRSSETHIDPYAYL